MANLNDLPETPQNPYANVGGPQDPAAQSDKEQNRDACMWAMFAHLAGFGGIVIPAIGSIIGPLVVWLLKKDQFPFVNEQGKEALNFQITMMIYFTVAFLLSFLCIGFLLMPVVGIIDIVMIIIATIKANEGTHFRYPAGLIFRFIK